MGYRVRVQERSMVLFDEDGYDSGEAHRRAQALRRQYPERDGYYVLVQPC